MPMKTKEQQREFQRNWIKLRRQKWIIDNGPCKHCGSDINLEIDHIDPAKKQFNVSSLWSRRKNIREKELLKCQVLCEKCHLIKTKKFYEAKRKHGTTTMYGFGCRCKKCKEVACRKAAEWYARKGLRRLSSRWVVADLVRRIPVKNEDAGS